MAPAPAADVTMIDADDLPSNLLVNEQLHLDSGAGSATGSDVLECNDGFRNRSTMVFNPSLSSGNSHGNSATVNDVPNGPVAMAGNTVTDSTKHASSARDTMASSAASTPAGNSPSPDLTDSSSSAVASKR